MRSISMNKGRILFAAAFLLLLFCLAIWMAPSASAATADVKYSPLFEASLANSLNEFAEAEKEQTEAQEPEKQIAFTTPTTGFSCGATCGATCGSTCNYSCSTTCGSTCSSTCTTTCGTTCSATCAATCGTTCGATCSSTCLATCGTTCQATCTGNSTCHGSYTCMNGATCQGSLTCQGSVTCSGATCVSGTVCSTSPPITPIKPVNPAPTPPSEPLPEQPVMDYDEVFKEEADLLYEMGLFKGSNKGYELAKQATRAEAAAMLVRLLGKEAEVQSGSYTHPFNDVPAWASPYVGYLYTNRITNGISTVKYGSSQYVTHLQYMTFLLKSLGYTENDFLWNESDVFAKEIALLQGEADEIILEDMEAAFRRAHMVHLSCSALLTELKGESAYTLLDKLIDEDVVEE